MRFAFKSRGTGILRQFSNGQMATLDSHSLMQSWRNCGKRAGSTIWLGRQSLPSSHVVISGSVGRKAWWSGPLDNPKHCGMNRNVNSRFLTSCYWMRTWWRTLGIGSGTLGAPSSSHSSMHPALFDSEGKRIQLETTLGLLDSSTLDTVIQFLQGHFSFPRKYLPALQAFPKEYIHEPWSAPPEIQMQSKCIIGKDYPLPILSHLTTSKINAERMRQVFSSLNNYRAPQETNTMN